VPIYILHSNYQKIAYWVILEILSIQQLKKRTEALKRFIYIADKCWEMKSFSVSMAILAGLNSSSIFRLKKTWKELSSRMSQIFQQRIKCFEKNYSIYRAAIETCLNLGTPCVPLLDVLVSDLVHANEMADWIPESQEETNEDQGNTINFKKVNMIGNLIVQFLKLQSPGSISFSSSTSRAKQAREYVNNLPVCYDNDALYQMSLSCEPRTRGL